MGGKPSLRRLSALTASILLALAGTANAAGPTTKPIGCMIEPDRSANVGSQVIGLIENVFVERGDRVRAGQVLMTLRAGVERANVGAAKERASTDAELLASKANLTLASQKLQKTRELRSVGFVSEQALDQAIAEHEVARQKLDQNRTQKNVLAEESRTAEAYLALRTVRSPFDGVVVDRFVNLGERVEEKPLLRIAVINPLRVELLIPTTQYGAIKVGDQISIRPELPNVESALATVTNVDSVLDAASNSFRVRLSLPNSQNRLPAGLRCKADLTPVVSQAGTTTPQVSTESAAALKFSTTLQPKSSAQNLTR